MKMTPNWVKSISYSYKEPKKALFTVPGCVIPGTNLMTINQAWGTSNMPMAVYPGFLDDAKICDLKGVL